MAIEIIPKPRTRKKIKLSWIDAGYYGAIFLMTVLVLTYFSLYFFERQAKSRIEEFDTAIAAKKTPESEELERRVFSFKRKLAAYAKIVEERRRPSFFFPVFASLAHQRMYYPELLLKPNESEAQLVGKGENLKALREQIMIFDSDERVSSLKLPEISISKDGYISFDLILKLAPDFFRAIKEEENQ